ncbi:MAG TPA: hypothetical protein VGM82_13600 [Gemmatimonadaceae bacterium]|jgi:streptogramin lyase
MKTVIALALALAARTPARVADGPWDGTWKLDRAKSHLTGQTLTLSKTTAGKWRYSDGTISFDFALDGKPVKTFADGTMAFTADGDHAIDVLSKSTGSESHMHLVLSADGKTITDHTTSTRPDGSKTVEDGAMARVGQGSGFAGTWKSTKTQSSSGESFDLVITGDRIKWSWPAYKRHIDGKMDGSEIHIAGATATPGMIFMMRKAGATKITYAVKGDGKSLAEGMLELSADGKTLTDTEWAPAKPTEKAIAVYTK